MLRGIFRSQKGKVTGEWRKLRNETKYYMSDEMKQDKIGI